MFRELEPNVESGQPITLDFMNDRRNSIEEFARVGWTPGLLPSPDGEKSFELVVGSADVLQLRHLRALGERGYPIFVSESRAELSAPPFDALDLPVGRYDLYACLAREKNPTGSLVEFQTPGRPGVVRRAPRSQTPRVVLAIDGHRLDHRDWIQLATLDRVRSDGGLRTELDSSFHPPVTDMAAYDPSFNPLPRFGRDALDALAQMADEPDRPRVESSLRVLLSVAGRGSPQIAFVEAVRCLGFVKQLSGFPLAVDTQLVNFVYSPGTMCRFLSRLRESLQGRESASPYPDILEVAGIRHLRADGEFVPHENYWMWKPSREGFVASGLLLYLPGETLGTLPIVCYGQVPPSEEAQFPVAEPADELSHPGAALQMTALDHRIGTIYLFANNQRQAYNLGLKLGNGHGVYYY